MDRQERYEEMVADQAREIADLRERHETWVRKSALMLEVGKNERTDLRDKLKTAINDHDALGEMVGNLEHRIGVREECAEALDNSVAAYRDEQDALRERVEKIEVYGSYDKDRTVQLEQRIGVLETQQKAHGARHGAGKTMTTERIEVLEKRMDAMEQSHDVGAFPHKRHNGVAEMCEDMGIDYEPDTPTVLEAAQESWDRPDLPDTPKRCENCEHSKACEDGRLWCYSTRHYPAGLTGCSLWQPRSKDFKPEQPDTVDTEELKHPRGNTPTAEQFEHPESIVMGQDPPDIPKTCETCKHRTQVEGRNWCYEIQALTNMAHPGCSWTPKPAQPNAETLAAVNEAKQADSVTLSDELPGFTMTPKTCETCGHYHDGDLCRPWCELIEGVPDISNRGCEWTPKPEQPDRDAEVRELLKRCRAELDPESGSVEDHTGIVDDITEWLGKTP